jgi:hypothetical protein
MIIPFFSLLSLCSSPILKININKPVQVFADGEIENTSEWIELSILKNKVELYLLQTYGCIISSSNSDMCTIHNYSHKGENYDAYREIVRKMNALKTLHDCKIDYTLYPFVDIFDKDLFDSKVQFLNILKSVKDKIASLEQQNKNYYYIAVNLSESKRFEEAIITLKKITKEYSKYDKVLKFLSFNKQKLTNQISYENRMNRSANIRSNFARKLEQYFLDKGLDTTVTANGEFNQSLYINYIFSGRVFAHNFHKSEMCNLVRRLGFTEIVFDSDYTDDTWTITLKQ